MSGGRRVACVGQGDVEIIRGFRCRDAKKVGFGSVMRFSSRSA